MTLRFVVENGQKTIWGSCENVIFIRNAGTNPKVMAVRSKVNVNRKNLIMSLADSCFEFLRDLEKEYDPDLIRRRAAEFAEDVRHYSRLIELPFRSACWNRQLATISGTRDDRPLEGHRRLEPFSASFR